MKDDLGGKIMKHFLAKGTKRRAIKRKLKFGDYKNCLELAQIENKINHLEKTKNSKQKIASTNCLI